MICQLNSTSGRVLLKLDAVTWRNVMLLTSCLTKPITANFELSWKNCRQSRINVRPTALPLSLTLTLMLDNDIRP